MEELIAKRYVKALTRNMDIASMQNLASILFAISDFFNDAKFIKIMNSPDVKSDKKESILLAAVNSANSSSLNNFIKLVVERNRIFIIPLMAEVLRKDIAAKTKQFTGVVYSNSDIDSSTINGLSAGLSSKFNSNIVLSAQKDSFDGVKVDVSDLGIEINFSKSRINSQMIEHIIKAI